ncbi:MAG: 30S ribosomal protein S12 methylthiotransferase RimO [Clostridia bacterium]|nr:30S ribosomal protein S12 methylthiotransferase RimO [Clostridia bacterium]
MCMKVGFVSLGCSKNLVDTEMMIGLFKKENFEVVSDPKKAEIIVVNTCGFIQAAKEEAINTIFEMAEYKDTGKCKYLIVTGCLVKRYKEELEKLVPEVDLFISTSEYDNYWELIEKVLSLPKKSKNTLDYMDRTIATGNTTAFLKISEGCSNGCTYCAIPLIRGRHISRPYEDIIKEAKKLAKEGIKEVIVIAQDTTKYGTDLYGKCRLPELLGDLEKISGFKWIRFLYSYPEGISDELIDVVKKSKKICHYFDMPIQHYSDNVLKNMHRKTDSKKIEEVVNKLRGEIPDVIIRTTLLVGFPGETEEDFFELYEFVNRAKFDKLGVFKYSKEDGTLAAKMEGQIHPKTKEARRNKIMSLEKQISKIKLEEKIGNTYIALVDEITKDGKTAIGRSYMDIPDEDGVIFIKCDKSTKVGDFIKVKITDVKDYDLIGEKIN